MRKSLSIGKIIDDFEVLDNYRDGKKTMYVVKCVKCGKIQSKDSRSVKKNTARCECSYRQQHHGKAGSKVYNVYQHMKQRCYNPKNSYFHRYGARGITVCDRWLNDFEAFYEDVSKLPHFDEFGYSLERINNDGNYELGNVCWATPKEQANNRSVCRYVEYQGKKMTLIQCAEELGIPYATVCYRLRKGQTIQCAFRNENVIEL